MLSWVWRELGEPERARDLAEQAVEQAPEVQAGSLQAHPRPLADILVEVAEGRSLLVNVKAKMAHARRKPGGGAWA